MLLENLLYKFGVEQEGHRQLGVVLHDACSEA